jgi:1-acyl-sn-glycerol-3-phosphate acyltransferase
MNSFLKRLGELYLRIMGWKIVGHPVPVDKCVIITAYHTSNWDFPLGLAVRFTVPRRVSWLAKHQLFYWPFGVVLRALGGQAVYRHLRQNVVGQAVEMFRRNEVFSLALAPEGTRKRVSKWKSGFYQIALQANVPIQCMAFDYKTKELVFDEPFLPTGELQTDVLRLKKFFNAHTPKIPAYADMDFTIE